MVGNGFIGKYCWCKKNGGWYRNEYTGNKISECVENCLDECINDNE